MTAAEHNEKLRSLRIEAGKLRREQVTLCERLIELEESRVEVEAMLDAVNKRRLAVVSEADAMGGSRLTGFASKAS